MAKTTPIARGSLFWKRLGLGGPFAKPYAADAHDARLSSKFVRIGGRAAKTIRS